LTRPELQVERRDTVAIVTLDRPQARNAISVGLARALGQVFDEIEQSMQLRACVLTAATGDTGVFCAGGDLTDIGAGRAAELSDQNGFAGFTRRRRRVPVIAAVDGLAVGGGCELVLACDLIVASARSAFGLPEVRRNLLASGGGVYRLPRALGTRVALEAVLTGVPIPAQRAYELGMVNHLVEPGEVLPRALTVADAIAAGAPTASATARQLVLEAWDRDERALQEEASAASVRLRPMADTAEGVRAFLERRTPVWQGN
jgi:enoyl-CoA hydratase